MPGFDGYKSPIPIQRVMEETAGVRVLLGDQRKGVIALAIPIGVALLMQQLNNIVDSLWVSGLGADPMAALGIVYPIYCAVIGIGNGLGIGVSAAIARSIGRKSRDDAEGAAAQGIIITVLVSAVLTPLLLLTADASMDLMGAGDMKATCLEYAYPIYLSTFFIIMSGVLSGMLRGEGAARRSMVIQAAGAVSNMVLDPIFIFVLDMGVAGAAWATSLSFVISCVIPMLWYNRSSDMFIRFRASNFRFDRRLQREILSVGMPEAVELSVMNFFNIFLNYYVIMCGGTDAVAIYSTAWRVIYILMMPAQSVGGAMVAVCSAEYGMRRFDMIRDAFRYSVAVSIGSLVALSVVLALLSDPIAWVFTHSEDLSYLHGEMQYLLCLFALFLPVMSMVYTGSSLMQSLDKAGGAMVNTLVRNFMLVGLFALAAYQIGSLGSVWWALTIGEIVGGLMMGVHAVAVLRRTERREAGSSAA